MNAPPCVLFEDAHLLVVNKPPGMNTHAPSPYAGEGIYEWLKNRERRWSKLAIIHRLDKETSGVMVFSKTTLANKSLTDQLTGRRVRKTYILLTSCTPAKAVGTVRSCLVRAGERYVSRPVHSTGEVAETRFRVAETEKVPGADAWLKKFGGCALIAEPVTGRTHQIRVHAADLKCPILGDTLYGGAPGPRLFLHAMQLRLAHPETGRELVFEAAVDFGADPGWALRSTVIDPAETDSFRVIHGAGDRHPGWYVEKLGPHLLSSSEQPLSAEQQSELESLLRLTGAKGASHKVLTRHVRKSAPESVSPAHVLGEAPSGVFEIRENGLRFEASMAEGYSFGLFLDQRDNRRRLLTGYVAEGFDLPDGSGGTREVLNTFAYTCGFSVASAAGGRVATSLDLSRKYLEWGRRNFELNHLTDERHDFIFGDAFGWMRRLAKRGRGFDVVILDPPTFSQSKESGTFQAERDYGKLVDAALPLLKTRGVLLASSNAQKWLPEAFVEQISATVRKAGREIMHSHYVPQPPDFPVTRAEPAYLKTLWLAIV